MTTDQLYARIQHIYQQCSLVVLASLGTVPGTAGNMAIFCQSDDEYTAVKQIVDSLVQPSNNPTQKYFQLIEPISISSIGEVPSATLSWLYVRKPAEDSPESGDVDFVLSQADYDRLKEQVISGKLKSVSMYIRPGWDMIEFKNGQYDGLPYISTRLMAERVRVRF